MLISIQTQFSGLLVPKVINDFKVSSDNNRNAHNTALNLLSRAPGGGGGGGRLLLPTDRLMVMCRWI